MKRKLLLLLAALLSIVSVQKVQAYTTSDLESAGWTKTTDLSSLTLADNYFVLVDAGASATAVAVGNPAVDTRAQYTTLANPFAASQQVWKVAQTGDNYTIQNIVNDMYFVGGSAGWNSKMSSNAETGDYTFTLNDGKYKLSRSTGYMGPWNENGSVSLSSGYEQIALNKGENKAPGFYVYYISRTAYEAARRNGAALASEGWSQVTETSGLNLPGYYYALLDMSESEYESGFAMTGATGGRPQSTALTDPITNTKQLWFIEGHGDNYALKCLSDNKYFYCKNGTSWDTGFTTNINDHADFTMTVNEGKWTLSNTSDGSHFVGRWGDNAFHPYDGESIAANKSAGAGKKQYLIYSIPTIAGVATELPANGDMVADTWYYIDIDVAGDDYNATATTLDDIVYTTDNTILVRDASSVTNKFKATGNSLSVARYYVKSSSANNLVVAAASYSYSVSEATVDKTYIQPGQIVTVSYVVGTNNPGAVLSQDYSGVTFNGETVAYTLTASGFTFEVPSVAAGAEYTLYIPAKAIGYAAGNTYNEAQNITLTTPVVYDGVYYFKVENDGALKGQYLSRGKNYGTHATVDKYGLAIKVATDGQNKTTLKPYDTDRFYRMDGNGWDCWADNTDNDDRAKFNLVAYNGHVLVHGITTGQADDYFKYNDGDIAETTIVWGDSHGTSGSNGNAIEFSLEDASAQAAAMQALKDGQAATAASAAYASGKYESLNGITTISGLEAELAANYIEGDLVPATSVTSVLEKYEGAQPGYSNTVEVVYSKNINITEPGLYKFSMQAFYRAGGNNRTQDMHDKNIDRSPVVLYFGTAETQIKSLYDDPDGLSTLESGYVEYKGKKYANNMDASLEMFQADKYHNDVYLYVSEAGEYTYGVKYLGYANNNAQWFIYSPESVTVTSYAEAADADDYAALATAITAFDNAVWGFETGEYAPYNNVEAIGNIEAAKAINPLETNSKLLVKSLTDKITLSAANASEVNAVYNGTFALSENDGAPAGWTMSNNTLGGAYHSRAFVGDSRLSEFNETKSGFFQRYDGTNSDRGSQYYYGNTTGYTMPLKASTVYHITADFTNWGTTDEKPLTLNVDGPNDFNVFENKTSTKNADTGSDTPDKFDIFFTTGDAGNYTIRFQVKGGDENKHNVIVSNIELKRSASAKMQISGTAKMGTFCAPFDVEIPGDVKAYTVTESTKASTVKIEEITSGVITAGTPVLVTSETTFEKDFEDYMTVAAPTNTGLLRGTFTKYQVPVDDNYILQYQNDECAFYLVDDEIYIGKNRCYLHVAAASARIAIEGDDPTAINSIEAAEEGEGLKDGKYLIDGQIVIVKNGVKYSANGQILK